MESVRDRVFGPAGLPPVSSSLCPRFVAPAPYDEGTNPALRGIPFAGPLTARVSAFADDITVFVSLRLDIKAVKKAVGEYERIAGAKVNFDKSEGLRLSAWRGSNTLQWPFRWSDGPVRILRVLFVPDLQLERNWSEVKAKVNAQGGIWLSRRLSLKGRAEACAVYVFPMTGLYPTYAQQGSGYA